VKLDLTALRKSIEGLDTALAYCSSSAAADDPALPLLLQTAAIKAFEYTYEVSWKLLKRYLEETAPDRESIEAMAFPDLIRTGNEQGLLASDWQAWKQFRDARNITSHVYDKTKAAAVFEVIPAFRDEAKELLRQLEKRLQ
jgi:nucleotidyltransferase substrate binding protein (TIGR01987 family)